MHKYGFPLPGKYKHKTQALQSCDGEVVIKEKLCQGLSSNITTIPDAGARSCKEPNQPTLGSATFLQTSNSYHDFGAECSSVHCRRISGMFHVQP